MSSNLGALAVHVLRVANPLFTVGSLTLVSLLAWRRAEPHAKLPSEVTGCLIVGGSIAVQALLLNTNYSGHPERLTVLSLLPFVLALAYLLRSCERAGLAVPPPTALAVVALLTVGSLHYLYTIVGPATAAEGAALQLIAAIVVGALLWRALAGRPAAGAG